MGSSFHCYNVLFLPLGVSGDCCLKMTAWWSRTISSILYRITFPNHVKHNHCVDKCRKISATGRRNSYGHDYHYYSVSLLLDRIVLYGWFSLYLISLFHYEINSFVVLLFLRLFLFDSHYAIKYFTSPYEHVSVVKKVTHRVNQTHTLFALSQNHFLSTLFQDIPKTFVHIGSRASAPSYIVESASYFYGVQGGNWSHRSIL